MAGFGFAPFLGLEASESSESLESASADEMHVLRHYRLRGVLGNGAFGKVCGLFCTTEIWHRGRSFTVVGVSETHGNKQCMPEGGSR